jgi:hypothetical protein
MKVDRLAAASRWLGAESQRVGDSAFHLFAGFLIRALLRQRLAVLARRALGPLVKLSDERSRECRPSFESFRS